MTDPDSLAPPLTSAPGSTSAPTPPAYAPDGSIPLVSRKVSTTGIELGATICGEDPAAPVVVLLAQFPLDTWTWRHQLPALADRGYRAVALDLRGLGRSDLQPGEVDLVTLATDVEGALRSLGAPSFTVVGAGIGGFVAWMLGHLQVERLAQIVTVDAPHPLSRTLFTTKAAKLAAGTERVLRHRQLARHYLRNPKFVRDLIFEWTAPQNVAAMKPVAEHYANVFARPTAARTAYETLRGATHLSLRARKAMATPVAVPVTSIRGEASPYLSAALFDGDADHAALGVEALSIPGVGQYPQEEAGPQFTRTLLQALAEAPQAGDPPPAS